MTSVEENQVMIEEHIGYAKNIAHKLYNVRNRCGLSEGEFESAAYFGLCEAATRYKPEKKVKFRSFCYPRLKGAIMDELRSYGNFQLNNLNSKVKSGGDQQTDDLLGIECFHPQLNIEVANITAEEGVEVVYADSRTQEEKLLFLGNRKALRAAIARLPHKERIIIVLHYFIEVPLTDICPMLNASKSWLSRLHLKALDRLKINIAEELCESPYKISRPMLN